MVLPADFHHPGPAMFGARQCRFGIALRHDMGRCNELLFFKCFLDAQDRGQFFIFDLGQLDSIACLFAGFGGDTENRLTVKLNNPVGQNRIIMGMGG